MQNYKSIRFSPTSVKVIEKLNANEDTNKTFGHNFNFVLNDYPTLANLLEINALRQMDNWASIKDCLVNFTVEPSDYLVTSARLNDNAIKVISSYALDASDINYSGTVNTMLEDFNATVSYLNTPVFTKKEWLVLTQRYNALPLYKLRITDEIKLAKNSLLMSVKDIAGSKNRAYDRLLSKLNNLSDKDALLLCCRLRGFPVEHSNSFIYG